MADISKSEIEQNILMALIVLILLGLLAFLYDKTQSVDLREQNEVMDLLGEVKDIDSRWDMEARRARIDLSSQEPLFVRPGSGDKALRDITRFAGLTSSKALRTGLPELRSAIERKSELVQKFLAENKSNKATLQELLKAIAEARAQSGARRVSPQLLAVLSRIDEAAPQYFLHAAPQQRAAMEEALARLDSLAAANGDDATIITSAQRLLRQVPVELQQYDQLEQSSTGPRLVNLTLSFNRELEDRLQEKERYRIYLVYYASALLVLLVYFAFRLKVANQTLEHRVEDRTRELSDALRHLKESEAQLIQSEKMSSLGQMVAGVAHEINTPLAYVQNSLGHVSEQLPDIGAALEHCEKLLDLLAAGNDQEGLAHEFRQTGDRVGKLRQQHVIEELGQLVKDGLFGTGQVSEIVGNLKNFSRLDRSKVGSCNLNDSLNSTLLLAKHQLKFVAVNRHFGDIPDITCAPSQINQVFLNLVLNAVQAMPEQRGTLTLTSRRDGEGVAVDVEDDGAGIPAELQARIFDPFFTTKEVGKGTGLGLSICYKIVQQHGGRISVVSGPGAGAKFTVWLPLVPPAEAQLEG